MMRFMDKVYKEPDGKQCWLWIGGLSTMGYGKFKLNGRTWNAHRLSYVMTYGEPPEDKPDILHRCNTKACVNPEHLYAGTPVDNILDAYRSGYIPDLRGTSNPAAVLNVTAVQQIKELYASGLSQTKIARRFGICQQQVSNIVTGKQWSYND